MTTATTNERSRRNLAIAGVVSACILIAAVALYVLTISSVPRERGTTYSGLETTQPGLIRLTREQQEAIGLKTARAEAGTVFDRLDAPGKVTPDESKYAFITPRTPGIVNTVSAQIGQDVKAGDVLATIDSPEVAQARFDFLIRSQELEIAKTRFAWQEGITKATLELIQSLKNNESPEAIQKRFEGRTVGRESREAAHGRVPVPGDGRGDATEQGTPRHQRRLPGPIPARPGRIRGGPGEVSEPARSDGRRDATRGDRGGAEPEAGRAGPAVARGRLRALGIPLDDVEPPVPSPAQITEMGRAHVPSWPAPSMGRYELRAPFAGTILDRETIVPGVPIDTTHRVFLLADLTSVWIEASVHESKFAMLGASRGGTVVIRSPAFPGREFPGKVLYTGDLVDEKSRTIKLLARAENAERSLKPGMFVNVEVRGTAGRPVTIIPSSGLLTSSGSTFVYVRKGPELFARRDVTLGSHDPGFASVLSGVGPGEDVVTEGGFKLKAAQARSDGG